MEPLSFVVLLLWAVWPLTSLANEDDIWWMGATAFPNKPKGFKSLALTLPLSLLMPSRQAMATVGANP